jgi:hypothetical protein
VRVARHQARAADLSSPVGWASPTDPRLVSVGDASPTGDLARSDPTRPNRQGSGGFVCLSVYYLAQTGRRGQGRSVGLSVCRFPIVRRQTDKDYPTGGITHPVNGIVPACLVTIIATEFSEGTLRSESSGSGMGRLRECAERTQLPDFTLQIFIKP